MKYQYNLYHRTAISMHTLKFINPSSFLLFGSCLLFLTCLCLSFTLLFFVCSLRFLFFSSLQTASLHSSFVIPSYCSFSTIAAYINSNPTFHNTTHHNKAQSCYRITWNHINWHDIQLYDSIWCHCLFHHYLSLQTWTVST